MIQVDTLLDELKLDKIKLLKIDVEGFELDVLEGLIRKLDTIQNIVIEILTPLDKFSTKGKKILILLQTSGFHIKDIYGKSLDNLCCDSPTLISEDTYLPEFNLLATRDFV